MAVEVYPELTTVRSIGGEVSKVLSRRRLRFAILVIISQLLLIVLALAWIVQMGLIAKNGGVYFVESSPFVLYGEITAVVLITLFAAIVFVLQCRRLGERRRGENDRRDIQG